MDEKLEKQEQNPKIKKPPMEDFAFVEDGRLLWWASWYAEVLGYKSLNTINGVIRKAKDTCVSLNIPLYDNFLPAVKEDKGKKHHDFKLTKFFCFLISLHADSKKPVVRRSRSYFLRELPDLRLDLDGEDYFERKSLRESLRDSIADLIREARKAQVKDLGAFINEGHLGLYNQSLHLTKVKRKIQDNKDIYDYMGMTEMSANIFRIALTEEKLKNLANLTPERAIREHWKISSKIRSMVKENSGMFPEFLPLERSLDKIERSLKKANKILNKNTINDGNQFRLINEEE